MRPCSIACIWLNAVGQVAAVPETPIGYRNIGISLWKNSANLNVTLCSRLATAP